MKDLNKTLDVKNGDFNLLNDATTLQQTQDIIINSPKGSITNSLLLGVGIFQYLNAPENIISLNSSIRSELKKDNIQVTSLVTNNGDIYIKSKNI